MEIDDGNLFVLILLVFIIGFVMGFFCLKVIDDFDTTDEKVTCYEAIKLDYGLNDVRCNVFDKNSCNCYELICKNKTCVQGKNYIFNLREE